MLRKRTLTAERQKSADVADDIDQSLPFSKRLLRREKQKMRLLERREDAYSYELLYVCRHSSIFFEYCWIYAFNVVLEVGGANGD